MLHRVGRRTGVGRPLTADQLVVLQYGAVPAKQIAYLQIQLFRGFRDGQHPRDLVFRGLAVRVIGSDAGRAVIGQMPQSGS